MPKQYLQGRVLIITAPDNIDGVGLIRLQAITGEEQDFRVDGRALTESSLKTGDVLRAYSFKDPYLQHKPPEVYSLRFISNLGDTSIDNDVRTLHSLNEEIVFGITLPGGDDIEYEGMNMWHGSLKLNDGTVMHGLFPDGRLIEGTKIKAELSYWSGGNSADDKTQLYICVQEIVDHLPGSGDVLEHEKGRAEQPLRVSISQRLALLAKRF